MIAARRVHASFALDRAVAWARALDKPLVVLEALRVDYPWASDRLHRFVLDGMADNAAALVGSRIVHHPYVEPRRGHGRGLLAALARRACVVVTDDFPCFFLPRMVEAAARRIDTRLEAVDGNGLLPLAATERDFSAAAHFRRYAQKELPRHLAEVPRARPLAGGLPPYALPAEITARWPRVDDALLAGDPAALARLPIDHAVPVSPMRGGHDAAVAALRRFLKGRLAAYAERSDEPSEEGTSHLSPYLHFGHIGAHEIFDAVTRLERWTPARLPPKATGSREGWWGMSPGAEAFLDQLVVWRELAYNTCAKRPGDYDRFESLPAWAKATLAKHRRDARPHVYSRRELEEARTHDPLWNAAQRQLLREGWYHGYLRMLWAKKILEWSRTPEDALETMIAIMNRWSLDGRNPNSYAGYFWTLGRYDRPWPERPVFGKVRSMSSDRTREKVDVRGYLATYGD
jgi:deoxyribodipyrimidine photo-lyase